jgi:hypothetical protein
MKIAIDVKGTLEGPKGEIIAEAAAVLKERGHEITVWSSLLSYAYEWVKGAGEFYEISGKKWRRDVEPEEFYDVAIEDDENLGEILAANKVIYVHEFNSVNELLGLITGENNENNIDVKSAI